MKHLIVIILASTFSLPIFAMPCDTGYSCNSQSGKYQIELNRCRYKNSLRLYSVKIDNIEIEGAELGASWDGKSVGDSFLAFEVVLPAEDGSDRVISVEIQANSILGTLKEKYTETQPDIAKVLHSEIITCHVHE